MNRWILQLGREIELCRMELARVGRIHRVRTVERWENLAEVENDLPEEAFFDFLSELGGTIRALRPLSRWKRDEELQCEFRPRGPWCVSALQPGLGSQREAIRQSIRRIVNTEPEVHGREIRVAPHENEVSPAKVGESGLAEREAEFCLWRTPSGEIEVGTTAWVFSLDSLAKRDVQKPFRPRRRGLLPAKLARQMVNLARSEETETLLDPFCGSGAVLIEGLHLGLAVAGSDNREEAIRQSRKNLDWFRKDFPQLPSREVLFLERIDVRQLSTKVDPLSLDAVVGEGDLGPPIRGKLSRKAATGFCPKLENLYSTAFAEIRTVLKPGGCVCLAVPFWQPLEGGPIFLNLERHLRLAGYEPADSDQGFEPILYRRRDQRVGRAIHLLQSPR